MHPGTQCALPSHGHIFRISGFHPAALVLLFMHPGTQCVLPSHEPFSYISGFHPAALVLLFMQPFLFSVSRLGLDRKSVV